MIPVDMQCTHDPPNSYGDCLRACIASLLELPAVSVPHFLNGVDDASHDEEWYEKYLAWLWERSLTYVEVIPDEGLRRALKRHAPYVVLTGPSPNANDTLHSVVGRGLRIAHDPAPSRKGLCGDVSEWTVGYLVPLDLSAMIAEKAKRELR